MQAGPVRVGSIQDPELPECSGLAASRTNPGVLWTHNDSGDGPFVYAMDETGKKMGTWRVTEIGAEDWEAIAVGPCPDDGHCLYVGDIGDNQRERREVEVYIAREPKIERGDERSDRDHPRSLPLLRTLRLVYPDRPHDAETLLIHPRTGVLSIITKKTRGESESAVFRVPSRTTREIQTLRKIAVLSQGSSRIPLLDDVFATTDGAISPDGRAVVLRDYLRAHIYRVPDGDFDEVWKEKPEPLNVGTVRQGESLCFDLSGKSIYTSSEGRNAPIFKTPFPAPGSPR